MVSTALCTPYFLHILHNRRALIGVECRDSCPSYTGQVQSVFLGVGPLSGEIWSQGQANHSIMYCSMTSYLSLCADNIRDTVIRLALNINSSLHESLALDRLPRLEFLGADPYIPHKVLSACRWDLPPPSW